MKSRLIDAAAFVIGVIAAFMQGGAADDLPGQSGWPSASCARDILPDSRSSFS